MTARKRPAANPQVSSGLSGALAGAAADAERSRLLERHIGSVAREERLRNRLTIADVAALAGISAGMLSRIENGQTAMSLATLRRIAGALGVSMGALFRGFDAPAGGAQLVKKDAGMEVARRGTKRGHTYHLLAYDRSPQKLFEPFLISMDDASEVFPTFEHPGVEFIYMLEGRIEYRHGAGTFVLEPGDALTFRGDVPHGPERLIKLPIRFLSVIYYGDGGAK